MHRGKIAKIRSRHAGVIDESKVARFYGSTCGVISMFKDIFLVGFCLIDILY